MKISMIFEFYPPPYRIFILEYFSKKYQLQIFSGDDKFNFPVPYDFHICKKIYSNKENKFYIFNFFKLFHSDIIITTLNLRRPHTWLPILFFPWKNWLIWGQCLWTNNNYFLNLLRRYLFFIAKGFVVYTPSGKDSLIEFGVDDKRISVAYNTLSVPNHTFTDGKKYLLYFGRVQQRKGIELILPYLKDYNLKLRIVGDGAYKTKLIDLVNELELSHLVDFFDSTFEPELIKKHFSDALAYVSPTHVGLGVVQAFSYGVPVFTFDSNLTSHAPEFSYCNPLNSYIISHKNDIGSTLLVINSPKNLTKKLSAYKYFLENLSTNNVIDAFNKHIE